MLVNLTMLICSGRTFLISIPGGRMGTSYIGDGRNCPYLKQYQPEKYKKRIKLYNNATWTIQQKFWYPIWGKRRQIEEGLGLLDEITKNN